jgi:hypothetical protein
MEPRGDDQVPEVVAELARQLRALLGDRLVGVYLGGSATMGDFEPASSDYDVLVVTEGALTARDVEQLERLHRQLVCDYADARRLEGDYAPRHVLVPSGTTIPVPGFVGGQFRADVEDIMLSADNLANMRATGIAVYGPPPRDVLPHVTEDDVRAAVLGLLRDGPGECATEPAAASELLNLVRSLCTLQTGQPRTKSEGARWAIGHVARQWHDVIRRAEAVRRGDPVSAGDTRLRTALPRMHRELTAGLIE